MTTNIFLAGLAGLTLISVVIFALTSKKKTEDKMKSDDAPSSLARDGKSS